MKEHSRYAPYAGYAAITFLLTAILLLTVRGRMETLIVVAGFLGIIATVAWAALDWQRLRVFIVGRTVKYGSTSLLLSVSVIGVIALCNVISNRYYYRYDATTNKRYSLSPQTEQILASIQEPIQVYSFFSPDDSRATEFEQLLAEYLHRSQFISYTPVDPDLQPALAKQLGVSTSGAIVFVRGDRTQQIFGIQEQDLSGALLRVLKDEEPKVYFLTGHRERDPESYDSTGYGVIATAMDSEGYQVESLNLAGVDAVPDDARILVIAGPREEISSEEETRIADYLARGGRLFILTDPGTPMAISGVLAGYGVQYRNDVIIDPDSSLLGNVATPLSNQYVFSSITRDMQGLTTFFPYSRSLEITPMEGSSTSVQPIVQTSSTAWGETDLQNQAALDPNTDNTGPLVIMAIVEQGDTATRIVVSGDSDFAANEIFSRVSGSGNGDLFLNAINWLAEEEELISIRPKSSEVRTVMMTPEQGRAVQVISTILLPLAVAVIGGIIWWRRRA